MESAEVSVIDCAGITGTIRGLDFGDGTVYCWDGPISGLGLAPVRDLDVDKGYANGTVANQDFYAKRTLTFPIVIGTPNVADAAAAWTAYLTLQTAWERAQDQDIALLLTLPNGSTQSFLGRPRGFVAQLDQLFRGMPVVRVLCTFVAMDPVPF